MTASDDSSKEQILAALRAYHGGKVYLMGSPALVAVGFDLHHEQEVASIEWARNFSCLHVRIGHAGRVVVNVRLKEEQVAFSCTCSRGNQDLGCEHAVCTVLTLKNLLMPEVFKPKKQEPAYRKALLAGLIGVPSEALKKRASGYAIVLEGTAGADSSVFITLDGEPLTKFADLLRTPLTDLAAADVPPSRKLDSLRRFLKLHGNAYPIIVRTGAQDSLVLFDPALDLEPYTEVSLAGNDVSVVKGLRGPDKQPLSFSLFGDLVYLPEAKKLALIDSDSAWEAWRRLSRAAHSPGSDEDRICEGRSLSFSLSQDRFNELHYGMARPPKGKKRDEALFLKNGKRANPLPAVFEYQLTISLSGDGAAVLRPQCALGSFDGAIEYGSVAGPDERKLPAASAHTLAKDGEWLAVSRDGEREALLFRVPIEVFGKELHETLEQSGSMRVSAGHLYERLPLLYERLAAEGIRLYLKGKHVKQARYAFSVAGTRKAGIDWFEVRPEIRCDGNLLNRASVESLLEGPGILEKEDSIQILDSNQTRVLSRIAAAYRAAAEPGRRGREVVRVPRLQILDWAALRQSGVAVTLSPEDDELVRRLLQFDGIGEKPLPAGLRATLRPYQRQGYSWLAFLYEHRLGACLADDMGLGKTVQAVALLAGIAEELVTPQKSAGNAPHLIVVPPSLVFNWEQELEKFYPGLKVHVYTGSERSDDFDKAGVVLTTYGTIRRDVELLKDRQFHLIIFDEAQAVKNLHADTSGAVRQLKGLFKLVMTGTPVENHLGEYYSVVDLAVPGLLGDYDRFRPLVKSADPAGLDVVIKRTRPFVLRRTKEEVLADLPPKTETDIYLDLTEEQKALYQRTVEEVRRTVDEAYRSKIASQARIIALTAILKLRQICVAPRLVDGHYAGASPKTDFLIGQLRELIEENHGALVFSQFTSFLDIVGEALAGSGIDYLRLDGSTAASKRKALVKEFQTGDGPSVFLLSLKAGGQGLNLTRASYVFHLDPWWNPAVENQASDRAHRIGQRNSVTVTRILIRHTIEEKMMELKKRKQALYEAILEDGEGNRRDAPITRGDFDVLLA